MKVIHIIPGAFNYFDDIRQKAMKLTELQREFGVEAEAFVLQYSSVGDKQKIDAKHKTPNLEFVGLFNSDTLVESLSDYDVIHLHCPFFGLANNIIKWKKLNPEKPLVISYYRSVLTVDVFSFFIMCYNRYYLPRIFKLSDAIINLAEDGLNKDVLMRSIYRIGKFADIKSVINRLHNEVLNKKNDKKLLKSEIEALAITTFYDSLIK